MRNNQSFGQVAVICPFCHSSHTQLIQAHQLTTQPNSTGIVAFSPMALANIGMQVSKRLNLPPMLGGLNRLGGWRSRFIVPQSSKAYQCLAISM